MRERRQRAELEAKMAQLEQEAEARAQKIAQTALFGLQDEDYHPKQTEITADSDPDDEIVVSLQLYICSMDHYCVVFGVLIANVDDPRESRTEWDQCSDGRGGCRQREQKCSQEVENQSQDTGGQDTELRSCESCSQAA